MCHLSRYHIISRFVIVNIIFTHKVTLALKLLKFRRLMISRLGLPVAELHIQVCELNRDMIQLNSSILFILFIVIMVNLLHKVTLTLKFRRLYHHFPMILRSVVQPRIRIHSTQIICMPQVCELTWFKLNFPLYLFSQVAGNQAMPVPVDHRICRMYMLNVRLLIY